MKVKRNNEEVPTFDQKSLLPTNSELLKIRHKLKWLFIEFLKKI